MSISKLFIAKVVNYAIVDTRKYRYHFIDGKIRRLPIDDLDTTNALTNWEIVWEHTEE